ncbi:MULTISPECIES: sugar phosphate isomerase/epimerase family protein [Brevibacillus]|uniref:Sugar phosphate isomerase/epimerase n=1 Tax=Brevibacillus invocatus TaxID=173959 RepID=A0A3M8CG97_9BACL|nr:MULTISPECIES: sugar phosphate isomerase/epimerase family protein [Brevibacillus]MDH4616332.1 sugar phosphate isomerase/epimerase [Brevibacillus sp. AY1]RNB74531.1 sugar phosphate isomerase/epimerase [Brevibacillus invocatus]
MKDRGSFSISSYALIHQPLREAIVQLVDDGWTSIEIMCEEKHVDLLRWSGNQLEGLKQIGKEKPITWSIHAPISGCNLAAEAGAYRDQTIDTMKRCLEIANVLDCTHVVMHAGEIQDRLEPDSRARGVEHASQTIRALIPELIRGRTILTIENVPPYPKVLGWNVEDLLAICKQAASPHVGIVYDVGHAHLIRPGYTEEALEQVLPYLAALHLSDNFGQADDHLAVGDGTISFAPILSLLQDKRFAGSWVVETKQLACAHTSVERLIRQLQ